MEVTIGMTTTVQDPLGCDVLGELLCSATAVESRGSVTGVWWPNGTVVAFCEAPRYPRYSVSHMAPGRPRVDVGPVSRDLVFARVVAHDLLAGLERQGRGELRVVSRLDRVVDHAHRLPDPMAELAQIAGLSLPAEPSLLGVARALQRSLALQPAA